MADTTIRAIIKLLVEGGHIPKEVAESLQDVGRKGKKTQEEITGVGQAAKEVGNLLKQYLGAAALGSFIKSSVTEFADLDRAWSSLGFTAKRVGASADDIARARTQMESLALSGGALQSQTVPALQKFITMTGDTDKALAAVKLASDVSESGITDFGSAASGVASLLQGRVKVAATQFGIDLTDINGKAKTNAALIAEITKTYGGLGEAFDDAANSIDSLNARWEQTKQIVGRGFAPALEGVNAILFHAVGLAKDLGEVFGLVFNEITALARGTGRGLAAAFDLKTLISDPAKYMAGLKDAQAKNIGEMGDAWKTFTDGIAANHTEAAAKVADTTKGLKALIQQATKATAEEDANAAADAAQKRLDLEHKTAQEVLQAQIAASKEGSQERLDLEKALLADQEQAAVEAAMRAGVNVNKIHAAYQLQRQAKDKAFAEALAAAEKDDADRLIQLQIDGAKQGSEERYQLEIDAINRRYEAEVAAETALGRDTKMLRLAWQKEISNKTLEFIAARAQAEIEAAGRVLDSERELRDAEFALALTGVEQNTADAYAIQHAAIDAHFKDVEDDLNRQLDANQKAFATGAEGSIAIQTELQNKLIANETTHATARKQLAQSVAQYKGQQELEAARTAIGALYSVFGKNQAMALAMITIDTALAVMEVWASHDGSPWYVKLAKTLAIGAIAEGQRQAVMGASPGGGGSSGGGGNAGSIAAPPTHSANAAADGTVVTRGPGGSLPAGFKPMGRDTEPFMLEPGEIVTPKDASSDVLSGRAVIAAGKPGAPGRRIVGGRLSVVPLKDVHALQPAARKSPTPRVASYAADGMVVPGTKPKQLGGLKGSAALMPQLAGAMGGAVKSAMQPPSDPGFAKIADKLDAVLAAKPAASTEPSTVDNSIKIEGNVYGGDEGLRQLTRELDSARRRDSNRIIR